jgi:hypothetical protein
MFMLSVSMFHERARFRRVLCPQGCKIYPRREIAYGALNGRRPCVRYTIDEGSIFIAIECNEVDRDSLRTINCVSHCEDVVLDWLCDNRKKS